MPPPLFLAADDEDKEEEDEDKEEEDEDKEEDGGLAPVLLCVGWDGGNVREGREGHHQEQGMG